MLAFGIEVVILVKIRMATHRTENFFSKKNEEDIKNNLDLLEERKDKAALQTVAYKQKMTKYYNSWVKVRRFAVGDLVLRKVSLATQDLIEEKLRPSWEGFY